MLRHKNPEIRHDESGFASIVIALVLIVVLALITVGFAQLARREQRNALDKQLASQAYYAAETGVNDAYRAINSTNPANSITASDPTHCYPNPIPGTPSNVINASTGVQYTCVLINLKPQALVKDMDADTDWYTTFTTSAVPGTITVKWNTKDNKSPSNDAQHHFTSRANWNYPAVLQFSLTPLNQLDRGHLVANTYTVFMYPSTDSAGNPSYSNHTEDQGNIAPGACNASGECSVTVTGLPAGVSSYVMHIINNYDGSLVTVSAQSGPNQLSFTGSQAVIDSTGQDKNVLKRIQVHVPIHPPADLPAFPLQAQNVCKRFTTYPDSGVSSNNNVSLPSVPGGFDTSSCSLN